MFKDRLKRAINQDYSFLIVTAFRCASLLFFLLLTIILAVQYSSALQLNEQDQQYYESILNVTEANIYWQEQAIKYLDGKPLAMAAFDEQAFPFWRDSVAYFNFSGPFHRYSIEQSVEAVRAFLTLYQDNHSQPLVRNFVNNYVN